MAGEPVPAPHGASRSVVESDERVDDAGSESMRHAVGPRFVMSGDLPKVASTSATDVGHTASTRGYANTFGQGFVGAQEDMQWSEDVARNIIKRAFWDARWNGGVEHLNAAVEEIRRRAAVANVDAKPWCDKLIQSLLVSGAPSTNPEFESSRKWTMPC